MNGRKVKEIRDILNYDTNNPNPISKRIYKKLKAAYLRVPAKFRGVFLDTIRKRYEPEEKKG